MAVMHREPDMAGAHLGVRFWPKATSRWLVPNVRFSRRGTSGEPDVLGWRRLTLMLQFKVH